MLKTGSSQNFLLIQYLAIFKNLSLENGLKNQEFHPKHCGSSKLGKQITM